MNEAERTAAPAEAIVRRTIDEEMRAIDGVMGSGPLTPGSLAALHHRLEGLHGIAAAHGSLSGLHRKHVRRLAALQRATAPIAHLASLHHGLEQLETTTLGASTGRHWMAHRLDAAMADQTRRLAAELPRRWKRTAGRMRRALARENRRATPSPSLTAATVSTTRPVLRKLVPALAHTRATDTRESIRAARQAVTQLRTLWSLLPEADALHARLDPLVEALETSEQLGALLDHIRQELPTACEESAGRRLDAVLTSAAPESAMEDDLPEALVELARAVHARQQHHFNTDLARMTGDNASRASEPLAEALERLEQDTHSRP